MSGGSRNEVGVCLTATWPLSERRHVGSPSAWPSPEALGRGEGGAQGEVTEASGV